MLVYLVYVFEYITRRYHIKRDNCLWLENQIDSTNLYVFDYKFKAIVKSSIELLEKEEQKMQTMLSSQ